MKPLPAKGFARALSKVALAGCAASLAVHLVSLTGFESSALFKFQFLVFCALFLVALPEAAAREIVLSRFKLRNWLGLPRRKSGDRLMRKIFFDGAPWWLRRLMYGLIAYFFVWFVGVTYETFPAGKLSPRRASLYQHRCGDALYSRRDVVDLLQPRGASVHARRRISIKPV
jgi:hypothetical protein